MGFFASYKSLKNAQILGMNSRNIDYISKYNKRELFPLVDDKLKTKLLAKKHGIKTPELIAVIRHQFEVRDFAKLVENRSGFAIKPACGSGGKGILVIKYDGKNFTKTSGKIVELDEIKRHIANILAGLFSLGGSPDSAIIEELIISDPVFDRYSFLGVPDIRIIVFRGFPAMAMLRLSTKKSDGKANLHQGAVGVGIDIKTGKAIHAVQFDKRISTHPDTKMVLDRIVVPDWQNLLTIASSCYEMTNLGYLGADLVLDKTHGAMLLELNARAGLAIQIANGAGLRTRLDKLENLPNDMDAKTRVEIALR